MTRASRTTKKSQSCCSGHVLFQPVPQQQGKRIAHTRDYFYARGVMTCLECGKQWIERRAMQISTEQETHHE